MQEEKEEEEEEGRLPGSSGGATPHSALTPAETEVLPIFTKEEPQAVLIEPFDRSHTYRRVEKRKETLQLQWCGSVRACA